MRIRITLKEALAKRGRTAYWLAAVTGKPVTTIYQLANEKREAVFLEVLESICDALKCDLSEILKLEEGQRREARQGRPNAKKHPRPPKQVELPHLEEAG